MAHRQVVVLGPPPSVTDPDIPCRLPIAKLIEDKRQWSLYIQALAAMQKQPWNAANQVSYWQLSSLHGLPYEDLSGQPYTWDTVAKKVNGVRDWCAHSVPTFPTWHRPYVSLFEQTLVLTAQAIVKAHPNPVDSTSWVQAADTLRAPYWDWAIDALPPDQVIAEKTLTILGLDGKDITDYPNPLFNFTYPTGSIPIEKSPKTVRHPKTAGDSETDVAALKKALKRAYQPSPLAETMRERIFKLHRDANTWEVVSNDGGTARQLKFREGLEQPHGQIHVAVGGGDPRGTMAWVPTAGFDPIFMLHHAQVDRQLALWQTYHYKEWIPGGPNGIEKRLTPFWDGKQEFNSSGPVKEFRQFQYRYPEFIGIPTDAAAASQFIWNKIVQLYGTDHALASEPAADVAAPLDWFAHLRTPIKSIVDSFVVFCFIGSVPENPRDWPEASNLAGTYVKFAGTDPARCANCRNLVAEGIEAHGVVDLTRALKHNQRYNQSERDVEKYLRDNLEWRIQQADGTVLEPRELDGFKITVWSHKLQRPRDGGNMPMFPHPGETPVFHDVTDGKPGGGPNPIS